MRIRSTDDVELELLDLGGEGTPVLIAHATGFCGGAYRPVAAGLTAAHHVWALDFRCHGASGRPASGDITWQGMIDDVLAAVDAIDDGPVHGLGHSMGGACLLGAEARRPGTLRSTYAFEPIVIPPEWEVGTPGENPLAAAARRRRPSFPSKADALARYASRPPLGLLRADALAAYVDHGFAEQPDGTVALRCAPEDEARVFEAPGKPTLRDMADVDVPVVVARGVREPWGPQAFAPAVADALPRGRSRAYDHLGHFGPFEDPTTVAADAAALFAENENTF
ncbi:MAG: alpha/beta fold hydrolase [Acidimicrobiales bacterium]|nr:alpha/beta fold hydrolase [Acidimicrobiales bacterium]